MANPVQLPPAPMANPVQYKWLPGPVGEMLRSASLATTATIPLGSTSLVVTTGHVGVNINTGALVHSSLEAEFHAVLDCLDAALLHAGVERGLAAAHKITAYFTARECEEVMLGVFRQRFPGHTPTWASVVVAELVNPGMHAELQAEAIIASCGTQGNGN
ncbi:endoribonuclease L-PSP family [Cordyceps militaris]|uniref:Endoribonuclease L-PSP family n=1 Tax=Cordyceps militaris TaxID=73501 RepID=A0A2H4SHX2_CORMI|nr:endoribonuclease L-PSP family [Cordyceps militaris]